METLISDKSKSLSRVSAIRLDSITKSYYESGERVVFSNFSLTVHDGEFVAVTGPVGSGKTTLLNIIFGTVRPDYGGVTILGRSVDSMSSREVSRWRLGHVSLVPQIQDLLPEFSVAENVALPLYFDSVGRDKRLIMVKAVLEKLGLGASAGTIISRLSVGERQMVAFARALVSDPAVLLLDEPTEALDGLLKDVVLASVRSENVVRKRTVVMASHDKRALDLANRVVKLSVKHSDLGA
ncbi:MAG: ATP-binding cassette domain-containing protein [Thaumarchaeota archaeon]|nr:ATP-binding cassette domain-containing protein [Nitrososphaerota archaeon]